MSSIGPVKPTDISPSESRSIRSGQEIGAPKSVGQNDGNAKSAAPARDRVELSAEGRALARASSLDATRVDSIRQRVLQGAYDNLNVIDTVARRMMQRGDI